jgi:hypothetical protein
MEIKTLQLRFKKYGVLCQQMIRTDDVAIYSLSYPENVLRIIGYAVVMVQKYTPKADPGLLVERFPFHKEWRKLAWSFITNEAAKKKYNELLEISK